MRKSAVKKVAAVIVMRPKIRYNPLNAGKDIRKCENFPVPAVKCARKCGKKQRPAYTMSAIGSND